MPAHPRARAYISGHRKANPPCVEIRECACGCGELFEWDPSTYYNKRFIDTRHALRGRRKSEDHRKNIRESFTEVRRRRMSERVREYWRNGGHVNPSGPASSCWKGGRYIDGDGFVCVRPPAPDHPRTQKTGYIYEHLLVAERVLGRPLRWISPNHPGNETVHHINGDRSDNRNCNLLICTHSYHMALHSRMRFDKATGRWKAEEWGKWRS